MKTGKLCLIFVLFFSPVVLGYEVYQPGYQIESFATVQNASGVTQMTFDDSGNLYTLHGGAGAIFKVAEANKAVTQLASGFNNGGLNSLKDLVWTGGTDYGDYLYANVRVSNFGAKIIRVDTNQPSVTDFVQLGTSVLNSSAPRYLAIDRTGNYGNKLHFGTTVHDRLFTVDSLANVSVFSQWPSPTGSGSPIGASFDLFGNFNNTMFVTSSFKDYPGLSGLFELSQAGVATRVTTQIGRAGNVEVDPYGTMFDGDLFVYGNDSFSSTNYGVWRIDSQGEIVKFGQSSSNFTFGPDGALYVAERVNSTNYISRITPIPEPVTASLLVLGSVMISRRNNKFSR